MLQIISLIIKIKKIVGREIEARSSADTELSRKREITLWQVDCDSSFRSQLLLRSYRYSSVVGGWRKVNQSLQNVEW